MALATSFFQRKGNCNIGNSIIYRKGGFVVVVLAEWEWYQYKLR